MNPPEFRWSDIPFADSYRITGSIRTLKFDSGWMDSGQFSCDGQSCKMTSELRVTHGSGKWAVQAGKGLQRSKRSKASRVKINRLETPQVVSLTKDSVQSRFTWKSNPNYTECRFSVRSKKTKWLVVAQDQCDETSNECTVTVNKNMGQKGRAEMQCKSSFNVPSLWSEAIRY